LVVFRPSVEGTVNLRMMAKSQAACGVGLFIFTERIIRRGDKMSNMNPQPETTDNARRTPTKYFTTRRLTYLALMVGLSVVGATLKIPSITGTPALDSIPGYLAAALFGAKGGALVISLGHLATALTAGFPLSLPIHLLIALGMAGCAAAYGWAVRRNLWLGLVVGVLLNGAVFPAAFILVPGFGTAFFAAMLVPLLIASVLNVALATGLYVILDRSLDLKL